MKKSKKPLFFAILLLIYFTSVKTLIDSIIRLNKYTFKIINNKVSGNGIDFLIKEAKNPQFFMIGELHGNKETSKFTTAVFNLLKPESYNNFAVEIGPSIIEQKNGIDALSKFYKKYNSEGLTNPHSLF